MDGIDGRTAIVTSAASGIGLALAFALAAAGSRVLMTDIDGDAVKAAATWVQANGGLVDSQQVDVRDEDAVRDIAQRAVEQFGALHIVVNNENIANRDMRRKQPLDYWSDAFDVRGLVNGIRGFMPLILESGGGHVVNIAPVAAVVTYRGIDPCIVSQNTVLGISEMLRVELASAGAPIGVSTVLPGIVRIDRSPVGTANSELVAEKVLDAIYHNRPYVYTDEYGAAVLARFGEILEAGSETREA